MKDIPKISKEDYLDLVKTIKDAIDSNSVTGVELAALRFMDCGYEPDKPLEEKLREQDFSELQIFSLMQRYQRDITNEDITTLKVIEPSEYDGKPLPKISWTIKEMLPEGVAILSAPPKSHKSFFALQMAVAICTGTDFFGYETIKGDCIFFDLESNRNRPLNRLLGMYDTTDIKNLHLITSESCTHRLDNGFEEELVQLLIRYPNTKLVVIDVLQHIVSTGAREYSYFSDYNTIGKLNDIANRFRISILAVHHTRKMRDDSDDVCNVSGTSGITGAVTTIFMLSKDKRLDKKVRLLITGNDIKEINWVMHFDDKKLCWYCDGDAAAEELRVFNSRPEVRTVCHIMNNINEWSGSATDLSNEAVKLGFTTSSEDFGRFMKVSRNDFEKIGFKIDKVRRGDARIIQISRLVS